MRQVPVDKLLSRVELKTSLQEVADVVSKDFELGKKISVIPMPVGYEELNCLLATTKGKFVVKIFSKAKSLTVINSNISALTNFASEGVPVPKLHKSSSGEYLFTTSSNPNAYLIVMDFFDGKKFTEITPSLKDMQAVANFLSIINSLSFPINSNYDMWLTINLLKEFADKKGHLIPSDLGLIAPVISDLETIDYSQLSKSIVHYDLHRENAMKNPAGEYCILDLASVDYNFTVFDLATFLALFCVDPSTYKSVVQSYLNGHSLSEYELSLLPLLIKATYSSNLLTSSYLQKTHQDENPEQSLYYQNMGREGLRMLKSQSLHIL